MIINIDINIVWIDNDMINIFIIGIEITNNNDIMTNLH